MKLYLLLFGLILLLAEPSLTATEVGQLFALPGGVATLRQ